MSYSFPVETVRILTVDSTTSNLIYICLLLPFGLLATIFGYLKFSIFLGLIKFYIYLACDFFFVFMILNYFYEHWNNKNRFRVFSQGLGRFIVGLIWPFGEVRVERMKRF